MNLSLFFIFRIRIVCSTQHRGLPKHENSGAQCVCNMAVHPLLRYCVVVLALVGSTLASTTSNTVRATKEAAPLTTSTTVSPETGKERCQFSVYSLQCFKKSSCIK